MEPEKQNTMPENNDIDNYPEIEVIEVPVVKKMVFQFNEPVELRF